MIYFIFKQNKAKPNSGLVTIKVEFLNKESDSKGFIVFSFHKPRMYNCVLKQKQHVYLLKLPFVKRIN